MLQDMKYLWDRLPKKWRQPSKSLIRILLQNHLIEKDGVLTQLTPNPLLLLTLYEFKTLTENEIFDSISYEVMGKCQYP